jgi:hypothetical protein
MVQRLCSATDRTVQTENCSAWFSMRMPRVKNGDSIGKGKSLQGYGMDDLFERIVCPGQSTGPMLWRFLPLVTARNKSAHLGEALDSIRPAEFATQHIRAGTSAQISQFRPFSLSVQLCIKRLYTSDSSRRNSSTIRFGIAAITILSRELPIKFGKCLAHSLYYL